MDRIKSFLRFDLIMLLLIIFIPLIFYGKSSLLIIFATVLIVFSRSTALYDNLKVEFHSVLIIAMSFVYGPGAGIFAAIVSAPLVNVVGKWLGCFQKPPWILMDTIALSIIAYLTIFMPPAHLFEYGLLTIIFFENVIVGTVRILIFNDPFMRRLMLSVVNIMFNYLILKNFLPQIIAFMR